MPDKQAEYANEVFRSRYNLGFVAVETPLKELELERKLVEKVTSFILELGRGFAFIGNQHVLCFNNKEYKVDMLFYHRNLRALVAVDLKIGEFRPEYVGKMNYYLSLLNKLEKNPDENNSIGMILCAGKDNVEVEMALEDVNKPIGVAEYEYLIPQNELKDLIASEVAQWGRRQ